MLLKLIVLLACVLQLSDSSLDGYREAAVEWEDDVAALIELNQQRTATPDDILFVGSSSIRLWDSIEQDMAGWSIVRRGYGGARYSDLAIYIDRLLEGHNPKAIIFFVGNDISGNADRDVTPAEVGRLTKIIADRTRQRFPHAPIFFLEVTPTPSRWEHWSKILEANRQIEQTAMTTENCYFIKTHDRYIEADTGKPNAAFFKEDQLHQNAIGYALWSSIIKAKLDEVFSGANAATSK
jgi:lysophospholipase L1-like esterase